MTEQLTTPRTVTDHPRPWGAFRQLTLNEPSSVKIISVAPGARLSKQRHDHRSELWEVLDGPLQVEVDGRRWTAQPGEQVWVPCGAVHRMGNTSARPARVLEVAFGDFDELDIERLEDDYSR